MDKKTTGYIILLGSAWGLSECAIGAGLNACASSISGSAMTAVALFFIATAWASGRKAANVVLLVFVAAAFKMFDALLLGVPLRSGAIANPIFAFALEGAGFLAVTTAFARLIKKPKGRGMQTGGASALLAAAAFPLVGFATGSPACLLAGTALPTAWAYAPLAVGLSVLTVPAGFEAAGAARRFAAASFWRVPAAVVLGLALMVAFRAVVPA